MRFFALFTALFALATLLAPMPALAVDDKQWEWSVGVGVSPETSDGRILLPAQRALPGTNLAYELTYGSERASLTSAVRYRFSRYWRAEVDFSLLSLPLASARLAGDGSALALGASSEEQARWGNARPSNLTPGTIDGSGGLASQVYNALFRAAGSPSDTAAREKVFNAAMNQTADIPLTTDVLLDNVSEGDIVQIGLFLNTYYDIVSSYPYSIYIGAGVGWVWSRLDDPSADFTHRVTSTGEIAVLGDSFTQNISQTENNLPDLSEVRVAAAFHIGLRQFFSEKLAFNAKYEYQLIEASEHRAEFTKRDGASSFRIGLDFLY